jgi:carbon-monoxide dehydrogenase medium subunit
MKVAPFRYHAPQTIDEAVSLLAEVAPLDGRILAGGQSLVPIMAFRLSRPAHLVDINGVEALRRLAVDGDRLCIGACVRHSAFHRPVVEGPLGKLLSTVVRHIAHSPIRARGTFGGSVAHADPSADYPAALVALEARIHLVSAHSDRTVAASDFFVDAFTTAMEPGEIVLDIQVPAEEPNEGYKYEKVAHPASGFPVVGVAVRVKRSNGRITMARIGVTGMAARAFRARNAEALLEGGGDAAKATALVGEGEDANSDLYASADYRRHLARVHAARGLAAALTRAS